MNILALDMATRTGVAHGRAGDVPRVQVVRLKQPSEPLEVASNNLFKFLRNACAFDRPDLIIYEAPWDPNVQRAKEKDGSRGRQNANSTVLPYKLQTAVEIYADGMGIRCVSSNRQSVLKHFTGRARWGTREAAKKAVIDRCHLLGLLPRTVRDDDRADAIAIHDYACALYARMPPRELTMFGEPLKQIEEPRPQITYTGS